MIMILDSHYEAIIELILPTMIRTTNYRDYTIKEHVISLGARESGSPACTCNIYDRNGNLLTFKATIEKAKEWIDSRDKEQEQT
jgi:hypothetical protein